MKLGQIGVFLILILAACSSSPGGSFAELPTGDAVRGAALFTESINGAPACSECHTLDGQILVGPSLQGYSERVQTEAVSASPQEYTYTSITQPAAHIVSRYSNTMYAQYAQQLSPQQIADLISYLLTL
jgi:mono/diheme cytochrome c family protein